MSVYITVRSASCVIKATLSASEIGSTPAIPDEIVHVLRFSASNKLGLACLRIF